MCVYVLTYTYIHIHTYVYIYICICVYMYICISMFWPLKCASGSQREFGMKTPQDTEHQVAEGKSGMPAHKERIQGRLCWLLKGDIDGVPLKGIYRHIDVEVDVDIVEWEV